MKLIEEIPSSFKLTNNEPLIIMVLIAIGLHAFVILGVGFSMPDKPKISQAIDIVIATTPQKKTPKKAKHLAQENQQAMGSQKKKPVPTAQKIPSQGVAKKKRPHKKSLTKSRPVQKTKVIPKVVTQKKSIKKVVVAEKVPEPKPSRPLLSPESLAQQIAQLGAKIRHQPKSSELSRIKFVNAVSTHKYLSANYERQWQEKVERIGNLNYPEEARREGLTGKLMMDVGIKADGNIYSIRIRKSSGHKTLDDAAKRIVRLGAPYAPLPKELREELDVLVITRVWKFSDESSISVQ